MIVVVVSHTRMARGPVVGRVEVVQDVVVTPLHEIGGIRLTMHTDQARKSYTLNRGASVTTPRVGP